MSMTPRRAAAAVAALAIAVSVVFAAPALAATGNDVGANLSKLLRHYAGELYGGVLAVMGLRFLPNRRYGELAVFLLMAVVVAWLVFSPDQIAHAARALGNQLF